MNLREAQPQEFNYLIEYLRENKVTYKEYLESDHWKETRQKRLSMPFCFCEVCGWGTHLNVHHNTYKNIGKEKMSDLTILCHNHHREVHEMTSRGMGIKEAVRKLGDNLRALRQEQRHKNRRKKGKNKRKN